MNTKTAQRYFEVPAEFRRYDGGKKGHGTYQSLINQIPPHDHYVELFLGSGGIFAHKRPALWSTLFDIDKHVVAKWILTLPMELQVSKKVQVIEFDAVAMLNIPWARTTYDIDMLGTFIFVDPPYIGETRRCKQAMYQNEMMEVADHAKLLERLLRLSNSQIMITCYDHEVYRDMLHGWTRWELQTMGHRGKSSTTTVYQNYELNPKELHDYSYIGADYREREAIARRQRNALQKIDTWSPVEQRALIAKLIDRYGAMPGAY